MRTWPPESSSTRSTKYPTAGVWAMSPPVLANRSSTDGSAPPALSSPASPPTLHAVPATAAVTASISAASRFLTLAIVPGRPAQPMPATPLRWLLLLAFASWLPSQFNRGARRYARVLGAETRPATVLPKCWHESFTEPRRLLPQPGGLEGVGWVDVELHALDPGALEREDRSEEGLDRSAAGFPP